MPKIYLIALGGAVGAVLRYAISGLTHKYLDGGFPWGTLSVNLVGAVAMGFLWGLFEETPVPPSLRAFVFVGIIASFTTFSTYCLETFNLLRDGEVTFALLNFLLSNVFGIALVAVSFIVARYFIAFIKRW